jgi:hypothetical protein
MLDWIRFRFQLYRLEREKSKAVAELLQSWQKLKTDHLPVDQEAELLDRRRSIKIEPIEEDVERLISSYLAGEAQKLRIAFPSADGCWYWSKHRHHYLLTRDAMQSLRSAIRTEKKEKSELAFRWLSGITGLLGALIGVLALILGRK